MGEQIGQELVPSEIAYGEMVTIYDLLERISKGTILVRRDPLTMTYILMDRNGNTIELYPAMYKEIVDILEGRR